MSLIMSRLGLLITDVSALARGRHPEPPSKFGVTTSDADALMQGIYLRGDRIMGWFILAHSVTALGLASVYDTWFVTIAVTLAALGLFFVNQRLFPGSFGTRVAAGVALQTFVALHIYQMHGLAEMHFFFFTAFTMMIVYQDWLCMWPGTLLIIGQHILFALLHNVGYQLYFFEVDYITLMRLTFHFGIAVIHVGVCGYWAVLLRRETLTEAGQRQLLRRQSLQLSLTRDKAVAATRAKSDFLATMSHEIRTPMNGVIGMAGILRETSLNAEQRECVDVIQQSGTALLRIINDILDFSKIEAGRLDIEVNNFELRPLVHGTIDLVSEAAAAKGLGLTCDVSESVPLAAAGDAGRIRQVFLNFLSNAIKYTPAGHVTVTVSATPATSSAESATELRFDVRDTGIGISPEDQQRLFESFSRVDAPRTSHISGTGLGLAICRRLAQLMGGDVGVSSKLGAGSTFWFTVVVHPAARDTAVRPPSTVPARTVVPPPNGAAWRVLVVDDNPVNQLVSGKILSRLHCRVDTVANGAEAVDAVTKRPYDLVLMDCQMPVMDGCEATVAIRKLDGPQARIPIIALTASALPSERDRCLAAGMDGYVTKPATYDDLAGVVGRWLAVASDDAA